MSTIAARRCSRFLLAALVTTAVVGTSARHFLLQSNAPADLNSAAYFSATMTPLGSTTGAPRHHHRLSHRAAEKHKQRLANVSRNTRVRDSVSYMHSAYIHSIGSHYRSLVAPEEGVRRLW